MRSVPSHAVVNCVKRGSDLFFGVCALYVEGIVVRARVYREKRAVEFGSHSAVDHPVFHIFAAVLRRKVIEDYIEGIEDRLHLFVNDSRSEITELAVSFCDNLYVDCLSFPLIAYRQEPTVCVDAVVKLTVHEKLTVSPSEVDE